MPSKINCLQRRARLQPCREFIRAKPYKLNWHAFRIDFFSQSLPKFIYVMELTSSLLLQKNVCLWFRFLPCISSFLWTLRQYTTRLVFSDLVMPTISTLFWVFEFFLERCSRFWSVYDFSRACHKCSLVEILFYICDTCSSFCWSRFPTLQRYGLGGFKTVALVIPCVICIFVFVYCIWICVLQFVWLLFFWHWSPSHVSLSHVSKFCPPVCHSILDLSQGLKIRKKSSTITNWPAGSLPEENGDDASVEIPSWPRPCKAFAVLHAALLKRFCSSLPLLQLST